MMLGRAFLVFLVIFSLFSVALPLDDAGRTGKVVQGGDAGNRIADGLHLEASLDDISDVKPPDKMSSKSGKTRRHVPVSTVAILTFLMAAASGLGAVPFFFFSIEASWQGICNGIACGVMLAASFDLISEGKAHGDGECVVIGILLGGLFILGCQKLLNQFEDVNIMDLKGADARRMILIISIMTLHSFGEGAGVGVSFAGPNGFSQGLLVTVAIGVHNIPEGLAVAMVMSSRGFSAPQAFIWSVFTSMPQALVAVPAFVCAEAFSQFLPICMGFAAGCMIWIVFGEVMPDSLKEANPSHVASAATISVAVMEAAEILFQKMENPLSWERLSPMIWSLLFVLGPIIGAIFLVSLRHLMHLRSTVLAGVASGIMIVIALWRPFQLFWGHKMHILSIIGFLWSGSFLFLSAPHFLHSVIPKFQLHDSELIYDTKKSHRSLSPFSILVACACLSVTSHAFMEGLMLGVAAPKAEGLGAYMLLPVSLHGLPRGMAVAAAVFSLSSNWKTALLVSSMMSLASPLGAVLSMLAGLDYRGLDFLMLLACGSMLPASFLLLPRSMTLDRKPTVSGLALGVSFALLSLSCTRLLCLNTHYCRSAPEAVT